MKIAVVVAAASLALAGPRVAGTQTAASSLPSSVASDRLVHGPAYWRALKARDFAPEAGEDVAALAEEIPALLRSTDPEIRDGIGYEVLVAWIYKDRRLSAPSLQRLYEALLAQAQQGLGESGSDGLFGRSFATLGLSVFAAADLKKPLLRDEQVAQLVELAARCLRTESDLRGFVPDRGWGHATAHTADLLKFLARNPRFTHEQQRIAVSAVEARLLSARQVFVWGEDARLAVALAAIATRPDADAELFVEWFRRLRAANERLWNGPLDTAAYVAVRAQLNVLDHLAAELATRADPPARIVAGLRELHVSTQ